jgi:hypothetical protein
VLAAAYTWSPANADLTFAQWATGPADKRAIYTAGVLGTLGVYAEVLGFVDRWKKCMETRKVTYGEVGKGTLEFAKKRENMDNEPAPAVMIAYMNERCGFTVFRKPQ